MLNLKILFLDKFVFKVIPKTLSFETRCTSLAYSEMLTFPSLFNDLLRLVIKSAFQPSLFIRCYRATACSLLQVVVLKTEERTIEFEDFCYKIRFQRRENAYLLTIIFFK